MGASRRPQEDDDWMGGLGVGVLALTAVGGVTWVRASHNGSPAPVDARLTLFTQGFDCSNGGATCNLPNALYAVHADTGAVRWEALAPANTYFVGSTPLVADGVVYAYTYTSPVTYSPRQQAGASQATYAPTGCVRA